MPPAPDLPADDIVEHVRETYGLDVRHSALLEGRTHAEAIAYRVDGAEGAYFLKLAPAGSAATSPIARHLADAGIAQVIAPLRTRTGALSARMRDLEASLYPYTDGENGFRTPLNEDQWIALGRTVRAVHDVDLPPSITETMRTEGFSDVWRERVRLYLAHAPSTRPGDSVAQALLELLATRNRQINALVKHAEKLAPAVRRRALPYVPCHGDLHAGNVLGDGVASVVIVDWDDPVLAPKERDLMFIGAGIGGVWNRAEESAAFYRGYGPVTVDAEALAYYRCERIVEDVAVFCDRLLLDERDPHADRELLFRKLASAFDPNDVVEIAERTVAAL